MEAFFLTGTDEHGIKIERSARERGVVQAWTDTVSDHFRHLWARLNISYDDFIRTSQPRHKAVAQAVFQKADEKGDIYKGRMRDGTVFPMRPSCWNPRSGKESAQFWAAS